MYAHEKVNSGALKKSTGSGNFERLMHDANACSNCSRVEACLCDAFYDYKTVYRLEIGLENRKAY